MLDKLGNSVQGQDATAENNVNAEFVSQNSIIPRKFPCTAKSTWSS